MHLFERARRRAPPLAAGCLELNLQRELGRTRAAHLVDGAQAPVDAAGPEATPERLHGLTEQAAPEVVDGVAEVGTVEEVEDFRAQVEPDALRQVELAPE